MAVINSTSALITDVQAFDGWGNNVLNPTWGAAGWAYLRHTVPDYDGNNTAIYVDPRTGTNTREYRNTYTSTLDASGLYGNDDNYAAIMIGERGMLKSWIHPVAGEMPLVDNSTGIFVLGGPSILCLPIMLLREHNRRARQYAITNPNWTDDKIFNRARRMVISIVQKITLSRYYPMVIGEVPPTYTGYKPNVDLSIDLFWSNVAQRYGHSSTNQVLLRYDEDGQPNTYGHVRLHDAMGPPTVAFTLQAGIEPFLRGFAMQPENKVDSRYVEELRDSFGFGTVLSTFPQRYDLAAVDIQKFVYGEWGSRFGYSCRREGYREMGLADYNTARRHFNLSEISTWSDLTPDPEIQGILASLYPNISRLDAYIGSVIEAHEGNAIVGPMAAASIKEQLLRIRDGDRFWWENPGVLTSEELGEIMNHSGMGQACSLNDISSPRENRTREGPTTAYTPEEGVNIMDMITLKWTLNTINNISAITFTLESNSTGWFGFGVGDNMNSPADMYLCIRGLDSVNWTVQDSYRYSVIQTKGMQSAGSTDFVVPKADILVGGTNNVIDVEDLTATQTASARVLRFTRYLNTGDPHDTVIASGIMPLLFAYGDVPVLGYHGPGNRAHASLDFFDTGSQIIVVPATDSLPRLKILHGVTMVIAFGIFYPSGIFIARFWHDARWLTVHQLLMNLASGNVSITVPPPPSGTYGDLTFNHSKIGITVACLVIVTTVSGLIVSKAHTRFPLKWSKRMRSLHRYAGYCGYLLGVANGFIGVLDISGNEWSLAYAYAGYVITVLVALSGFFQIPKTRVLWKTAEDESKLSFGGQADHSPMFTWQEVAVRVRAGAKWIVIENSVCEDATNFFQGESQQHAHSRLALSMMKDLAVGRVSRSNLKKRADAGESSAHQAHASISASHEIVFTDDEEANLPLSRQSVALDPSEFRSLTIMTREILSEANVARPVLKFRLAFQNPTDSLVVRPGDCIHLMFTKFRGGEIVREYTPIASVNTGYMDLMIKMINGPMTSHLLNSPTIAVRGPQRRLMCLNPRSSNGCWSKVGMIAGGVGVTPMLLMIDYHMRNAPRTSTGLLAVELSLLHIFTKEDDRFGMELMDAFEREARGALKVHRLIAGGSGDTRKINADTIASLMPFRPASLMKLSTSEMRRSLERRPSTRSMTSEKKDTAILICGYVLDG
ncbi:heme peroxidase [Blyttiomyces helicus]|uniref:Heme peroxidase n=1 Tax=Blyttiomyces helicus TaxID=388810 RepID=A0A4P9WKL4_9FUNG|nr:heme peroxidase [Blyttiomyces helicus]|eukprot:RKO93539.1 heme peroxidase [Blyttiomyces helicus]